MMSRRLNPFAITIHIIFITLLTYTLAHAAQRRTALVIGNGDYAQRPLRNPVNDAIDMSAALKKLGFDVMTLKDANLQKMEDAVNEFSQRLSQGGLGLFYYAGHGVQVSGENYLIPVDAQLKRDNDVRYKALALGQVLGALKDAKNQINLVLLDACRNNPFTTDKRSLERGLAVVSAAKGTLIGYATGPNEEAADGKGRNGTYTEHLLKHMATPGLPVELMLKQVRTTVDSSTNGEQIPWTQSSLIGDVYLAALPQQPQSTRPSISVPPSSGLQPPKNKKENNWVLYVDDIKQRPDTKLYVFEAEVDYFYATMRYSTKKGMFTQISQWISKEGGWWRYEGKSQKAKLEKVRIEIKDNRPVLYEFRSQNMTYRNKWQKVVYKLED